MTSQALKRFLSSGAAIPAVFLATHFVMVHPPSVSVWCTRSVSTASMPQD